MLKLLAKENGMTLIEILLAIALLGILSIALLGGIPNSFKTIYVAGEKSQAVQLAQNQIEKARLAELKADYTALDIVTFPTVYTDIPGNTSFQWKVEFKLEPTSNLVQMTVRVKNKTSNREYELTSLRPIN